MIRRRACHAVELVATRARLRAAYVFGSQATGTAGADSDIDIAAFIEEPERLGLQGRIRLGVAARERVGDDIEIHFLPAEFLSAPPRASFAEFVLRHGVCIWDTRSGG